MKPNEIRKRKWFIFIVLCVLVLGFLIEAIFLSYHKELNDEFDLLVEENLTAYAESQAREVSSVIRDTQNILLSVSSILSRSGLDPAGEEATLYLNELSANNTNYRVTYHPLAQLRIESPTLYEAISHGRRLVSEVSTSLYFVIAVPVYQNDKVVGGLIAYLQGAMLAHTLQTNYFQDAIISYLIKRDGTLVPIRASDPITPTNFFDSLEQRTADRPTAQKIRAAVENYQSATFSLPLEQDSVFFISLTPLYYNNWYLINFTAASDVQAHSKVILKQTIRLGLLLVLITVLTAIFVAWFYRRQGRVLALQQARYSILEKFSDTVLFEYSYSTDSIDFTANAQEIFLLPSLRVESFTREGFFGNAIHPEDLSRAISFVQHPPEQGKTQRFELRMKDRSGNYVWYLCQGQALYGKNNAPLILLGKLVNISEQREKERSLIEKSQIDELTGIYNKAAMREQTQQVLPCDGYLIMLDLDNFKAINDMHGHNAGDEALSQFGTLLRNLCPPSALIGRIGGDEFAIFLPAETVPPALLTSSLLTALCNLEIAPIAPSRLSCSIGISSCPHDGVTYEALYCAADAAMYCAKQCGKGCAYFTSQNGR